LLGDLIEAKTGNRNYTLKQLYQDHAIRLVIVVTNLTLGCVEYLDEQVDIPIRLAIRMSMSIPFVFAPVRWNDQIYADGGLLDNYAIRVFDGETQAQTLGLCIKSDDYWNSLISRVSKYCIPTEVVSDERTITIPVEGFLPTQFKLTSDQKQCIIECGVQAVREFKGCE